MFKDNFYRQFDSNYFHKKKTKKVSTIISMTQMNFRIHSVLCLFILMLVDGACLSRNVSTVVYETRCTRNVVCEDILSHVADKRGEFRITRHVSTNGNYYNTEAYTANVSRPFYVPQTR